MITVTIIIYSAAIFKGVLENFLKKFVKKRNGRGRYALIEKRSVCTIGKRFYFLLNTERKLKKFREFPNGEENPDRFQSAVL